LFFGSIKVSVSSLFFPLILLTELIFVVGVSLFVSACYVYFRDVARIWSAVAMLWLFVTPVFYSAPMLPQKMQSLLFLNPLTHILTAARTILLEGKTPSLFPIGATLLSCLILFFIAYTFFKKIEPSFAEVL